MRTCYLLVADLDVARRGLAAALVAASADIRAGDRHGDDVERAVLARFVRAAPRDVSVSGVAMGTPDAGDVPGAVWAALAAMPAPARTALVLRAYDGFDAGAVASLLRRDPDQVAGAYETGLADMRSVLPAGNDEARLDELGRLLADRAAADVPLEPAPYERVAPLLAARRRRRLVTGVAAVLVLALLAGGYALATAYWRPGQTRARGSVLNWPTRGSLAGDQAFLDAAERRAAADARVLYAGDLPHRRVALVLRSRPAPARPATRAWRCRAAPTTR